MRPKRSQIDQSRKILQTLFPPVTSRGDATRVKMVESTIKILATDGLDALTFEKVGKPLGMNRSQVRYHFPELSHLIDKAIEYTISSWQNHVIDALKRAKTWEAQIETIATSFLSWADTNPESARLFLLFYYLASKEPHHRGIQTTLILKGIERVVSILEEFGKKNRLTHSELTELAQQIWALIDGVLLYRLSSTPDVAPKISVALNGIRALLKSKTK